MNLKFSSRDVIVLRNKAQSPSFASTETNNITIASCEQFLFNHILLNNDKIKATITNTENLKDNKKLVYRFY